MTAVPTPFPGASAPMIRRVSRREIAENQHVWHATVGMFFLLAAMTVVTLVLGDRVHETLLIAYLVGMTTIAVAFLRSQPPPMDSAKNHGLLASVYLCTTAGLFVFQPYPEVAIGASLFIGPLTVVRLQSRRAIIGHFIATSVLIYSAVIFGGFTHTLNTSSILAGLMIVFGAWSLGVSCLMTLEAAETQGDELERLVRRDPLTGVGNRRMLIEQLEDELPRHARIGKPLALIALDLNGFKALNDEVGHAAGDELLRIVAEALARATGPRDVVVRQGGDEFCVILTETSDAATQRTANSIRASLASIDFEGKNVSSGMGIATFPDDADRGDVLMHLADTRLGENKRQRAETAAAAAAALGVDRRRPDSD